MSKAQQSKPIESLVEGLFNKALEKRPGLSVVFEEQDLGDGQTGTMVTIIGGKDPVKRLFTEADRKSSKLHWQVNHLVESVVAP